MHGIIWFTTTQAFGSLVDCFPQTCHARTRVPVPGRGIHLGTGHSRGLLRIAAELEELASKVLTVEMVAARERQSLREQRTGALPAGGLNQSRRSKGLFHVKCSRCRSFFLKTM